jgi:hypothetical protein
MDIVLSLGAILLASIGVWLWKIGKADLIRLSLQVPGDRVSEIWAWRTPKRKSFYRISRKAIDMLEGALPLILLIATVASIICGIYFIVVGRYLIAFTLVLIGLIGLLVLIYFSFAFLSVCCSRRAPFELITSVGYVGEVDLPKKVYEGDSQRLSIILHNLDKTTLMYNESLTIQEHRDRKLITVQTFSDINVEQFLEVELYAPWMTVDGDKRQRQPLKSQKLSYRWNCYFPNSGDHSLDLVLRQVDDSNTIELGVVQHAVKVVKFDHMTQRQVWILASLAGIVSGVFAILAALNQLGWI